VPDTASRAKGVVLQNLKLVVEKDNSHYTGKRTEKSGWRGHAEGILL
jgi:hypothetical protein